MHLLRPTAIEQAKIAQKVKAGASGDVIVPTDSFTTACAASVSRRSHRVRKC